MEPPAPNEPRPPVPIEIVHVGSGPDRLAAVRALFEEYATSLGVHPGSDAVLEAQGFALEVATLPGAYGGPNGALLLAERGGEAVGCVALRPLTQTTAELKRLFVRPTERGTGLGERLVRRALEEARRSGYASVRLDTLPFMVRAIALYEALGFEEVAPYRPNPMPGSRFFECTLGD